jgi:uncharacterized CHY-type Zn-finger protein
MMPPSATATLMKRDMQSSVRGIDLDSTTRCAHYHTTLDIVAIKMKCCGTYYACRECHDALAGHSVETWPSSEWDQPAVLCGACGTELSIRQYMECANECPICRASFNPGCCHHYHYYFETVPGLYDWNRGVLADPTTQYQHGPRFVTRSFRPSAYLRRGRRRVVRVNRHGLHAAEPDFGSRKSGAI